MYDVPTRVSHGFKQKSACGLLVFPGRANTDVVTAQLTPILCLQAQGVLTEKQMMFPKNK